MAGGGKVDREKKMVREDEKEGVARELLEWDKGENWRGDGEESVCVLA